jgi:hypothetical protein
LTLAEYWDNQVSDQAEGDWLLGENNPPNKTNEPVYRAVQNELAATHVRVAINQAVKSFDK